MRDLRRRVLRAVMVGMMFLGAAFWGVTFWEGGTVGAVGTGALTAEQANCGSDTIPMRNAYGNWECWVNFGKKAKELFPGKVSNVSQLNRCMGEISYTGPDAQNVDISKSICKEYRAVCKKLDEKSSDYNMALLYEQGCGEYESKATSKNSSGGNNSSSASASKNSGGKSEQQICVTDLKGKWNNAGNCVNKDGKSNFASLCSSKLGGAMGKTGNGKYDVCVLNSSSKAAGNESGSNGGDEGGSESGSNSDEGEESKPVTAQAEQQKYKDCPDGEVRTSVLFGGGCVKVGSNGEGIFMVLNLILTIMTYGVGVLATIGILLAGYTYLTAKDDASKVQKSKDRILQVVIGLVVYALIWVILQFLLPGGLFGNGS